MSIRNLDKIFAPQSVALIGVSGKAHSVGAVIFENVRRAGFAGPLYLVNPHHQSLDGVPVYPDIKSLPAPPDLAIIATPPETVPGLVADLGARGTKGAVVITAGFGELGKGGEALQQRILEAAEPHLLRLIGPNCLGVMVPGADLDASFSHLGPLKGNLAFVSQSGALVTGVLDWAQSRGIGFSHVVSLGDMADVDFGDMIDYLANDPATRAILLYIEGLTHARKFMSAARAAARSKPVVVVKAGRLVEGARAAHSHTGALAGSDAVYDAAFRRAGMLRVETMAELFDAVETLALTEPQKGGRLAILTNGGGPGVLATDALIGMGGTLASLSPATLKKLDQILPSTWSRANPVDIIGDAPGQRYAQALNLLLAEPGLDGVLVLNCPTALASSTEAAEAVIGTLNAPATGRRPNLFTAWLGEKTASAARALFAKARIATYDTPDDAVLGFMHRLRHHRARELLMETPASPADDFIPDRAAARAVIAAALAKGRRWLDADEVEKVLTSFGIPVVASRLAANAEAAAEAAQRIGGPVVLKIRSPDITHKSDVGGVALNLAYPERVRHEAIAMEERVRRAQPGAVIDGFLVQAMVQRPGAIELIAGLAQDQVFGPVILFGQGGTAVALLDDTALELPPLNRTLARAQMARTRVWRLLQGYRDRPAADIEAIARVLIRLGDLAAAEPAIAELDLNPLLADAEGAIVLDARILVAEPAARTKARLAISPYPSEFVGDVSLR
ncbi:MAG TPA: acetate--CoA ligase family protein, partial [Stellaceae bacterium]|nr:acetate--CoA ligase family protein [Stellaceae bacterium]